MPILAVFLPLIVVQCVMVSFQLQINVYQIGNGITKTLKLDLLTLTRHRLKTKLTKHLIKSYD